VTRRALTHLRAADRALARVGDQLTRAANAEVGPGQYLGDSPNAKAIHQIRDRILYGPSGADNVSELSGLVERWERALRVEERELF